MNTVIESTTCLVNQVLTSVKHQLISTLKPGSVDNKSVVNQVFSQVANLFCGIETEPLHASYIKGNFNHMDFVEICLGKKLVRKKKGPKRVICEKYECFVYVPILDSLKQVLSNKRIAAIVL